jgi:hypothetical protein
MPFLFESETGVAMFDVGRNFLKRTRVEDPLDTLTRGELAASMLCIDPLLAAAEMRRRPAFGDDVALSGYRDGCLVWRWGHIDWRRGGFI